MPALAVNPNYCPHYEIPNPCYSPSATVPNPNYCPTKGTCCTHIYCAYHACSDTGIIYPNPETVHCFIPNPCYCPIQTIPNPHPCYQSQEVNPKYCNSEFINQNLKGNTSMSCGSYGCYFGSCSSFGSYFSGNPSCGLVPICTSSPYFNSSQCVQNCLNCFGCYNSYGQNSGGCQFACFFGGLFSGGCPGCTNWYGSGGCNCFFNGNYGNVNFGCIYNCPAQFSPYNCSICFSGLGCGIFGNCLGFCNSFGINCPFGLCFLGYSNTPQHYGAPGSLGGTHNSYGVTPSGYYSGGGVQAGNVNINTGKLTLGNQGYYLAGHNPTGHAVSQTRAACGAYITYFSCGDIEAQLSCGFGQFWQPSTAVSDLQHASGSCGLISQLQLPPASKQNNNCPFTSTLHNIGAGATGAAKGVQNTLGFAQTVGQVGTWFADPWHIAGIIAALIGVGIAVHLLRSRGDGSGGMTPIGTPSAPRFIPIPI